MAIDSPYYLEPFRLIVDCKFLIGARTFRFYPESNVAGGSTAYIAHVNAGTFPVSFWDLQGTPIHLDYYPEINVVWSGRPNGDPILEYNAGYIVWGQYQHSLNGELFTSLSNNTLLDDASIDPDKVHLYGYSGIAAIMTSPGGTQWLLTATNNGTLPVGVPASYPGQTAPSDYRYHAYRISDVPAGETLSDHYDLMDTWNFRRPPAPFFYYTDGLDPDYTGFATGTKFSQDGSKFATLQYWYYNDLSVPEVVTDWRYVSREFSIANESSGPALTSDTSGVLFSGGWTNTNRVTNFNDEYICGVHFVNNILKFSEVKYSSGSTTGFCDDDNECGSGTFGTFASDLSYDLVIGGQVKLTSRDNFDQHVVRDCRKTTGWTADMVWPECGYHWYLEGYTRFLSYDSAGYIIHANYPELDFLIYTEVAYSKVSYCATGTCTVGHYVYRAGVATKLYETIFYDIPGTPCETWVQTHDGPVPSISSTNTHECSGGDGSCNAPPSGVIPTDSTNLDWSTYAKYMRRPGAIIDVRLASKIMHPTVSTQYGTLDNNDIIHDTETGNIVVSIDYETAFKEPINWLTTNWILRQRRSWFNFASNDLTTLLAPYDERFDTVMVSTSGTVTEFITQIAAGYTGDVNTFGLRMWPSTYAGA